MFQVMEVNKGHSKISQNAVPGANTVLPHQAQPQADERVKPTPVLTSPNLPKSPPTNIFHCSSKQDPVFLGKLLADTFLLLSTLISQVPSHHFSRWDHGLSPWSRFSPEQDFQCRMSLFTKASMYLPGAGWFTPALRSTKNRVQRFLPLQA